MIIRSSLLRHGRLALAPSTPLRSLRRAYTSTIEQTYTNPHADQQYIAGAEGATKSQAVSQLTTNDTPDYDDGVKEDWEFFHHQKRITDPLGSSLAPHYRPHELLSNPPRPQDITLELLMASQSHIGHSTSLWHPGNAKYIFGVRGHTDPIHIISLDVTAAHLRRACKIVHGVTERGGLVLFVGSREGQSRCVVKAAQMAKGCHLFTKWIPGSITNGQQILGKCRKKVVNQFDQEVPGFEEQLLANAVVKPDLVVCLNPLENYVLLHECGLNNIPTIGIVDTDVNPTWVTYPIPANDDSLRCVQVIAGVLGRAGQEGQESRILKAGEGIVDYQQDHGLEPPKEEDEEAREGKEKEVSLLKSAEAFDVTALEAEQVDEGPVMAETSGFEMRPMHNAGAARREEQHAGESAGTELDDVFEMVREVAEEADSAVHSDSAQTSSPQHESGVGDEGDWPAEQEGDKEQWREERP